MNTDTSRSGNYWLIRIVLISALVVVLMAGGLIYRMYLAEQRTEKRVEKVVDKIEDTVDHPVRAGVKAAEKAVEWYHDRKEKQAK